MRTRRNVTGGLLATVLLVGCEREVLLEERAGLSATGPNMAIVSGDGQTAQPGTELPKPLVVRVTDSSGAPLAGRIVSFKVVAGGGKVYAGVGLTNAQG